MPNTRWLIFAPVAILALFAPTANAEPIAGLQTTYYTIDSVPPVKSDQIYTECGMEVENNINRSYDGEPYLDCTNDLFMVHMTGTIIIPEHQTIEFWLASDDGGTIKIGTHEWGSWNDQGCSATESGQIHISAGSQPLDLWMYENGGGTCLMLAWNIDDTGWAIVPDEAFTTNSIQTDTNTTIEETTTTLWESTTTSTSQQMSTSTIAPSTTVTATSEPTTTTLQTTTSLSPTTTQEATTTTTTTEAPKTKSTLPPESNETSTTSETSSTTDTSVASVVETTLPTTQSTEVEASPSTVSPTTTVQKAPVTPSSNTTVSPTQTLPSVADSLPEPPTSLPNATETPTTVLTPPTTFPEDAPLLPTLSVEAFEAVLSDLQDALPDQITAIVNTLLNTEVTSDQAVEVVSSAEVLESISGEQAQQLFDAVDQQSLSVEEQAQIVEAVQEAPTAVKKAFEDKINIFGGAGFDDYVPVGSNVNVAVRRTIIVGTTILVAMPSPVVRRNR